MFLHTHKYVVYHRYIAICFEFHVASISLFGDCEHLHKAAELGPHLGAICDHENTAKL